MNISFKLIKYRHDNFGLIELIFILGQSNQFLHFDGANFELQNNAPEKTYQDWKTIAIEGVISAIKQTEDFDFIIKLKNDSFLKICFFPDDSYPNNVVQTITVLEKTSPAYYSLVEDFTLHSSDIDLEGNT